MSAINPFQPGTIHIYKVPFVDASGAKSRPVLITSLPNSKGDVMGIPGSSQTHQWNEANQIVINPEDLLTGELDKPTVFPVSKQMVFSPHFFCGEVGAVSVKTLEKVIRLVVGHQVEQYSAVQYAAKPFEAGTSVVPPPAKSSAPPSSKTWSKPPWMDGSPPAVSSC